MEPSPIRYTKAGDVHIAYRTLGEGPIDLVFVSGAVSNLQLGTAPNMSLSKGGWRPSHASSRSTGAESGSPTASRGRHSRSRWTTSAR